MPIGYGPPDADKVPLINIKLYSVTLDVWPKRLLRDDGTPHLPACHALFQIVRWYMPTEEFDGTTKARYYRKRYKGDQLQLSAPQLASASGLTVKQARDALEYLEHRGYINRTLVTLYRDGLTFPKSQFIALNVEAVIALSTVTVNDTDAMYKKAEANTEWDDDDYSVVPPGATDLQGIRSDPKDTPNIPTIGASALQDRPFFPQVIHHKSLHLLTEEAEGDNYVISTEFENPNSDTPPESVSPITVSGSDVVKVNLAGALHNAIPATAQVFAEMFPEPAPPVKEKSSKAANAKSAPPPKPKKEPKPPRELDPREAEFLAQVEQLDPFMGKQVESRLRKYRRDKPWSALQVYLLTGKPVPPASLQAVTSLNGTAFDTELMLKCLSAWTSKGWSPMNLAWLLEWYKAGGPPQYGKYGQQTQQPAPVVVKSDAELEAENDKHNAEVLAFHEWLVSTGRDTRTGYNAITRAGAAVSNVDLPYYDQEKLWYAEYQAEQ